MSDTFAGLSRRLNDHIHDRDTAEELSHIVEETAEPGLDGADAIIELALDVGYDPDSFDAGDAEDSELDVVMNIEEDGDDAQLEVDEDGNPIDPNVDDMEEGDIDGALDLLAGEIESEDAEDASLGLGEAAKLRTGELLIL
jgi:hypothetical protein